jgi:hypothetical protein
VQQHQQAPSFANQVVLRPTLDKSYREAKKQLIDPSTPGYQTSRSMTLEAYNKQGTDCTYTLLGLPVIRDYALAFV